jgi:hypothetical protein
LGRDRRRAGPAALPALGSAPALGAVTAAVRAFACAVSLLRRAQLDGPDGRGVDRRDRDSHRPDRDRAEDEAEREQGHGARRDRAALAPVRGVINETILIFVVSRVGHAPCVRSADRVKEL